MADPAGDDAPRPKVLLYRGGCGLRYDRESPAGLALTAAIERAVPGRARVYDEPGERLLIVEPHDAIARALLAEHFPDVTTETAPFTPPRRARVGGLYVCPCCGKGIDAATVAHRAGRRAA